MPVAEYIEVPTPYSAATTTFNEVLADYPLSGSILRFLASAEDQAWTTGVRFPKVTVNLSIASSKTVEIRALSTLTDLTTFYEVIGSQTITGSGSQTIEVPVTFNANDFLGVMILTSATDYTNEITLVSIAPDISESPGNLWTNYQFTTEVDV